MIIKTKKDEFQNYLTDASNYKGDADSVYIPKNETELIELLKKFNEEKIKVTISGNGTGLTGARVPESGIVISTEKLNKILELNKEEKFVIVQPAVILSDLQSYVEEKNLFYPPDPTERNCFVGSTVATNSSGARTFKYGPTRNYVLALKVILTNGETIYIERGKQKAVGYFASLETQNKKNISFEIPKFEMPETKNASGYYCKENMDLIDLFIGSEGTLGIITEIKFKLIDYNENILSAIAFFENENDAFNFSQEARKLSFDNTSKIDARGLEFFDHRTLNYLRNDYSSIPNNTCAIWFEQEIENNEDEIIDCWMKLILKHNSNPETVWLAVDKKEQEKFKDFRHAIAWKVNEIVAQRNLRKVGTDIAIPDEHFVVFYKWMKNLVEENKIDYVVYGHIGNNHPHLNMIPKNENEFHLCQKLYFEICKEAVKYKGTVSAEHGIGKTKRDYLLMMYGEHVIKEMAKLKLVFDPNKILNIGNIFDEKYLEQL
ncbi:MAG: FAD-binding oxidoreductase [Melioribacteraceae bacterium]|nr:FAD-binding oxidoreductase [Melioribacteraceae bacterium]